MIESVMLCGIGLLAGCLLMLALFPFVHERAVRITKRQITEATPLTVNEIQADKDHLRAEFAMSVRRLEIGMGALRTRAVARSGRNQNAEIGRLKVELDKRMAMIFLLRTREEVRKNAVRRVVKIILYLFERSRRRDQQRLPRLEQSPPLDFDHQAEQRELAATAAAIATINLKRRQAVSNKL